MNKAEFPPQPDNNEEDVLDPEQSARDEKEIKKQTDSYLQKLRENADDAAIKEGNLVEKTNEDIKEAFERNTSKETLVAPDSAIFEQTVWSKPVPETPVLETAEEIKEEAVVAPEKEKGFLGKLWDQIKGASKKTAVVTATTLATMSAMGGDKEKGSADSTSSLSPTEQTIRAIENSLEINDEIRADWNDFSEWLKPQGLQGSPTLDHNGLGMQKLREYVESHPGTSLRATEEGVKQVQAEFIKYRKHALNEIKAGKAAFSPGTNEKNFMAWLSKYDGIPGQFTTKSKFPGVTETHIKQTINTTTNKVDEKITVKNKGFAKIGKDYTERSDTVGLPGTDIARNK